MYFNFQYSLTGKQQSELQVYLRFLPEAHRHCAAWELLHELTYADDSSGEPKFKLASGKD